MADIVTFDPRRPPPPTAATTSATPESLSTPETSAQAITTLDSAGVSDPWTQAAASAGTLDRAIAATLAMESETTVEEGAEGGEALAENGTSPSAVVGSVSVSDVGGTADDGGPTAADSTMRDGTSTPVLVASSSAAAAAGTAASSVEPHEFPSIPPSPLRPSRDAAADPGRPNVKPKGTSSMSRVAQLTARVEKDPMDGEAQLALLQDAEQKGDLERTREVYENFLKVFPDAVSVCFALARLETCNERRERERS
jgi:cleavage stimulation factor subunit 3